eukprot:351117-Chlamydomonas_euryale.AAC.1
MQESTMPTGTSSCGTQSPRWASPTSTYNARPAKIGAGSSGHHQRHRLMQGLRRLGLAFLGITDADG